MARELFTVGWWYKLIIAAMPDRHMPGLDKRESPVTKRREGVISSPEAARDPRGFEARREPFAVSLRQETTIRLARRISDDTVGIRLGELTDERIHAPTKFLDFASERQLVVFIRFVPGPNLARRVDL